MRRLSAAVVGVFALLLSSCSAGGSEYEYAIPEKICRINVSSSDVKSLLPPGKAVKENLRETPGESQSCGVIVDKRVDLAVSFSRQTGEVDIAREAADDYEELTRVSLGGAVSSAAVAEDGAVAWMACNPKPNQPQYETPASKAGRYTHLVLEIHAGDESYRPGHTDERRARIEKFLRAYVQELAKVWCE
ncbi:hypothetical protein RGF97_15440 [Streptomyces roseicoloratus]|uniref:Lipoprotein n=1 Tax=Streptomyces roseicoloratus TaxID=2508722 RepID=A0ABY9RWS4_9ACTN|nr:hypothetical protein [Streptomyces roseicoloratus]WMX45961.1 hypothetical protein RGF97_15440 [Streptomyces roseicoloratus]